MSDLCRIIRKRDCWGQILGENSCVFTIVAGHFYRGFDENYCVLTPLIRDVYILENSLLNIF